MLTYIRVINGIIACIALFGFFLFASMAEPGLKMMAPPFGIIVILYLLDIIFRKVGDRSDVLFGTLWTLVHFGTLSLATKRFAEGDIGSQSLEISFLIWTVALCFGPFLVNFAYLLNVVRKNATV